MVHNLIKWESTVWCTSLWASWKWGKKEKDCSATVGVDPLMTQVFDLSTLKLSLQLEQLPPKGHSGPSPRLD